MVPFAAPYCEFPLFRKRAWRPTYASSEDEEVHDLTPRQVKKSRLDLIRIITKGGGCEEILLIKICHKQPFFFEKLSSINDNDSMTIKDKR